MQPAIVGRSQIKVQLGGKSDEKQHLLLPPECAGRLGSKELSCTQKAAWVLSMLVRFLVLNVAIYNVVIEGIFRALGQMSSRDAAIAVMLCRGHG